METERELILLVLAIAAKFTASLYSVILVCYWAILTGFEFNL